MQTKDKAVIYVENVTCFVQWQEIAVHRTPALKKLTAWLQYVVNLYACRGELTVRFVGRALGATLNHQWRGHRHPTNVISFPYCGWEHIAPLQVDLNALPLGDLILCVPQVEFEAREQGKFLEAHWAHIVVHGMLHLLGFDHIAFAQRKKMELAEISILARFGFPDPYQRIFRS